MNDAQAFLQFEQTEQSGAAVPRSFWSWLPSDFRNPRYGSRMIELEKFGRARTVWLAPTLGTAFLIATFVATLAAQPTELSAQPNAKPAPTKPARSGTKLVPNIEMWTLDNGLQVAFVRTNRAPSLAVQVWYRAGSKLEPSDRRGTAHIFEHLMFRGSKRVPPNAHTRGLQSVGGYANAITTEDGTAFHNTIPASQLDHVLALEADRMRSLVFDPKTIKSLRNVLAQEIQRNLRSPLYEAVVRFLPFAFEGHPYSWTSGGNLGDIGRIDAEGLTSFYNQNYVPNNALVVVVGDVAKETVASAVAKNFGKFEKGPDAKTVAPPKPLSGAKKVGPASRLGFAMAGFRIPEAKHPDTYVLNLLSLILSRGERSRLFQTLVATKHAVEAGGQAIVREQAGVFMVFAAFQNPTAGDKVEEILLAELKRIATSGVSAIELKRAVLQARAALGFSVQSIDGIAQQVGTSWVQTGNPAHFSDDLDKFGAVTRTQIKDAAKKYFAESNRVVVRLPIAGGGGATPRASGPTQPSPQKK